MTPWRVGSVPFLNERPLTYGLGGRHPVSFVRLPPGPLAAKLVTGELDVALIPVAEQLRYGLHPIGALGIACRGSVQSVQLWHDGPRAALTRILVPQHSRSSVLLLRLLLPHWGCPDAKLVPTPGLDDVSEPPVEPALIIGDAALRCLGAGRPSTDLGAAWHELTGLPFVFARWAARPGLRIDVPPDALLDDEHPVWQSEEPVDESSARLSVALINPLLANLLTGERDPRLPNLRELVASEAPARGIPLDVAERYLRESIIYRLDDACEQGQAEFARRARALGAIP